MLCLLRQYFCWPGTHVDQAGFELRNLLLGWGVQSLLNTEGIVKTLTKGLTWLKIQNSSLAVEVGRSVSMNTACSGERLPQTLDFQIQCENQMSLVLAFVSLGH